MFKFKLKAFLLHFLVSLIIVLISSTVIFYVWYPAPLYKASGVQGIYLIVLGIGLVVGPVLTFLVSKPNKKSLKFDLVVVVLLQMAGFFYGLYQVYDGRPAWIAYNIDRFDLIRNNEIDTRKLAQASPEYQIANGLGARYVAAVIPKDNSELGSEILFDEIGSGIAPSQRPELYQPLSAVKDNIMARSKPIDELYDYNDKLVVDKALVAYPITDSYLPLKAYAMDMVVLINNEENGKVVDIVDLRPW